ncbi:MAG: hypothetical protein EB051_01220, partial [Chlamydiia bacterium]|nr:hypothetical protein [Chlamydiia bacterium]
VKGEVYKSIRFLGREVLVFYQWRIRMNIYYVIKNLYQDICLINFFIFFFKKHFNVPSGNNLFMRVSRIRLKLSKIC